VVNYVFLSISINIVIIGRRFSSISLSGLLRGIVSLKFQDYFFIKKLLKLQTLTRAGFLDKIVYKRIWTGP
jgi:hypothetical protein